MVAFDTNVVVRVLVGDDPAQTKRAESAFVKHANAGGVFVSLVSLAEIGWVLAGAYGWDRAIIHGRIQRLVRTRNVFVEDVDLVDEALEEYREGRAELADYLILGKARERADELLTFNRKLAKEQGASLL